MGWTLTTPSGFPLIIRRPGQRLSWARSSTSIRGCRWTARSHAPPATTLDSDSQTACGSLLGSRVSSVTATHLPRSTGSTVRSSSGAAAPSRLRSRHWVLSRTLWRWPTRFPEWFQSFEKVTGCRAEFRKAFGSVAVSPQRVSQAIASFERTLLSGNAPFDRLQAGDTNAISESAQRGFLVFMGKGNCGECHPLPNFTAEQFPNPRFSQGAILARHKAQDCR